MPWCCQAAANSAAWQHHGIYQMREALAPLPLQLRCLERRLDQSQVGVDHDANEFLKSDLGFPIQQLLGFARVTDEEIDLRRAFIPRVVFDKLFPVKANSLKSELNKFANTVGL